MNIRQFIHNQKEQHHSRRSAKIEQAMTDNKVKLARAKQERAYQLQKQAIRQTKQENFKLKTQPVRDLSAQAKQIIRTMQKNPAKIKQRNLQEKQLR